jgi:hypothetical protein
MKPLAALALFLSAPSLFAAADLRTAVIASDRVFRAGFHYSNVRISVTNFGTDTAVGVQFSVTSSVPISCICQPADIPPGQNRERFIQFDAPLASGPLTFIASATSSTPDANPADNTVSVPVPVSADPDLDVDFGGPNVIGGSIVKPVDLVLPFPLTVIVGNFAHFAAHEVELTIDLPAEAAIASLPEGCSSSAPGRIVCRAAEAPPMGALAFKLQLTTANYGSGSLTFTASVAAREPDFSPGTNRESFTQPFYKTTYVTTTANDGSGSLRQAIAEVNASCFDPTPCTIAFRIDETSSNGWKTIRITSPLPALMVPRIRVEGATQTGFFGDTNPDGPEIEISGGGDVEGDGLVVGNCVSEIANLAVNGFGGNGISVIDGARPPSCSAYPAANLHHLFVGTDPTGSAARPNLRGIGTAFRNGTSFPFALPGATISDSVISGNTRSGIFGLSGLLFVQRNRIGVKAHSDEPLPNGGAGVFVGFGGYGSDVGSSYNATLDPAPGRDANVIAFNGQMGVAIDGGIHDVGVRNNRIWGNGGLGIDIGLDGPTPIAGVPAPRLTLAHYDPAAKQTIVEGDLTGVTGAYDGLQVDFFANDAVDPSGFGEGQRPLGLVHLLALPFQHFRFAVDGDLTGQRITATGMRVFRSQLGKVAPQGIDHGYLTQTSEFSRPIEVR